MTDKINYKAPSSEQLVDMQEFANISSQLLEIMIEFEPSIALQNATTKVNEAMMWFHAYILNGGKRIEKENVIGQEDTKLSAIN